MPCEAVMRYYVQDNDEQDEVDGMKKGADSTGKVMQMRKSGWWFVTKKMQTVELMS